MPVSLTVTINNPISLAQYELSCTGASREQTLAKQPSVGPQNAAPEQPRASNALAAETIRRARNP